MSDNNNQGAPSASSPQGQVPFFTGWYPSEAALIQQFVQKNAAGIMPFAYTADGTPIHAAEMNLSDPNNLNNDSKKKEDESEKPSSIDDEDSSTPLTHENVLENGTPRRGKKRSADAMGNWDDTNKVRRQSHNVAEKRRRDKINEKIRELKQLLPKSDTDVTKSSINKSYTLEQAIEYIRKLEQQNSSLWEQQQLLQEENRYLKLLRATYNIDDGTDKSKELEAQILSPGTLKSNFNAMNVQLNNNGSPSATRPSNSPMLVWTQFAPNFAQQSSSLINKTSGNMNQGQLFPAGDNSFQYTNNMPIRQLNTQQMAQMNSNMPGSPKSNSVNVNMFDSLPKSNPSE